MIEPKKPIRLRFAPSPTGELHLGVARTALYNYLFVKKNNGRLIFRIEDTDQSRYIKGSMERFLADLEWLGIKFDEGPSEGGEFGPYIQSERVTRHRQIADQLVSNGSAYYCYCSAERLNKLREKQQKTGEPSRYDRYCRDREPVIKKGEQTFVIRLKVPETGKISFNDLIRGEVEFDLTTIDDQILLKSDGFPTYHLASVVDDHDMEISHVARAEEWLPSTPKHLLIYRALDWEAPIFVHLPLLLANDKKKLSKRIHGASVWISTYRSSGYLPEALVNYLALLGWNPGTDQEFFSIEQLMALFDWQRVHRAGAVFDQKKLDAFQGHYIRALKLDDFIVKLRAFVDEEIDEELLSRIAEVIQSRIVKLAQAKDTIEYFKILPNYPTALLIFKKSNYEQTIKGARSVSTKLEKASLAAWNHYDQLNDLLVQIIEEENLTNGDVFWPIRVALTGQQFSPPPAECLWILGRDESLIRIKQAIEKLHNISKS